MCLWLLLDWESVLISCLIHPRPPVPGHLAAGPDWAWPPPGQGRRGSPGLGDAPSDVWLRIMPQGGWAGTSHPSKASLVRPVSPTPAPWGTAGKAIPTATGHLDFISLLQLKSAFCEENRGTLPRTLARCWPEEWSPLFPSLCPELPALKSARRNPTKTPRGVCAPGCHPSPALPLRPPSLAPGTRPPENGPVEASAQARWCVGSPPQRPAQRRPFPGLPALWGLGGSWPSSHLAGHSLAGSSAGSRLCWTPSVSVPTPS